MPEHPAASHSPGTVRVTAGALSGFDRTGPGLVAVGHWTDPVARTGCTVVVLPEGTIGSAEVRGGAPATREFDVLAPTATVQRLDAVVLSGGSAFGLAAVDGALSALSDAERGFPTAGGVVPIVAGMSLFDLAVGSPEVRPGATEGRLAAEAALGPAGVSGAPSTAAPVRSAPDRRRARGIARGGRGCGRGRGGRHRLEVARARTPAAALWSARPSSRVSSR
ncbi:MAG: P1 family peptidase [Microthrixaceae bacterium]